MGEAKRRGTREERVKVAQTKFMAQAISEEGSIEVIEEKLIGIYNQSPRGQRYAEKLCRKLGISMRQIFISRRATTEVQQEESE